MSTHLWGPKDTTTVGGDWCEQDGTITSAKKKKKRTSHTMRARTNKNHGHKEYKDVVAFGMIGGLFISEGHFICSWKKYMTAVFTAIRYGFPRQTTRHLFFLFGPAYCHLRVQDGARSPGQTMHVRMPGICILTLSKALKRATSVAAVRDVTERNIHEVPAQKQDW